MINPTSNANITGKHLVPIIGLLGGAVAGWQVYTRYYKRKGEEKEEEENPPTPQPPTDSFPRQVYD